MSDFSFRLRRADDQPARLVLGSMNFGKRTNEKEAKAILARAVELGVRHIDTANVYVDGTSERIVGAFARSQPGLRERLVIATKCGFNRIGGKPEGLSKKRVLEACDESLGRLGLDVIDVYYLHGPDHQTPIEETLEALAELLEKKKIRSWGVSNYAAWQVLEMIELADKRNMPRPAIAQLLYNVLIRQLDVEWFAFAKRYGVHTTVYNPLAGGLLAGKHTRGADVPKGSRFDKNRLYLGRYFTDAMFDRVEELTGVAREAGLGLLELAYAWLATAPGVDSILLGPASVEQLEQGIAACAKPLAPEVRTRIDALHRTWLGTDTYYVR